MTYLQLAKQLNETYNTDEFMYEGESVEQNPELVGQLITAVGEEMIRLSGSQILCVFPTKLSFNGLYLHLRDESYNSETEEYEMQYTFECSSELAIIIERLLCMNSELNKEYSQEQ